MKTERTPKENPSSEYGVERSMRMRANPKRKMLIKEKSLQKLLPSMILRKVKDPSLVQEKIIEKKDQILVDSEMKEEALQEMIIDTEILIIVEFLQEGMVVVVDTIEILIVKTIGPESTPKRKGEGSITKGMDHLEEA